MAFVVLKSYKLSQVSISSLEEQMAELSTTLIEVSAAFALLISVAAYLNRQRKDGNSPKAVRVPVRVDRRPRRR